MSNKPSGREFFERTASAAYPPLPEETIPWSFGQSKDKFIPLNVPDWKETISLIAPQTYPVGVELFRQGSPAQDVYYLDRGIIKFIYQNQSGHELIAGLSFLSGSLLGTPCAVLEKHLLTAVVLSRSRLRRIPANIFCKQLKENAELSWHFHKAHCYELYQQVTRMAQLGCLPARHRLEQLLWQLVSELKPKGLNKEVRLEFPLKHWEIAQLIAVTPEYLSRMVKSMEREEILRREKGWIIILDPDKLRYTNGN